MGLRGVFRAVAEGVARVNTRIPVHLALDIATAKTVSYFRV